MRKHLSTIILILVFLVGLSLLLYPSVSDYWNAQHQSRAIASYVEEVVNLDNSTYDEILKKAKEYNAALSTHGNTWELTDEQRKEYEDQLDVGGTGIMGYIEIPKIKCSLPIYHGTDEAVLQIAIGHIEGSSLPVGGESTHCVLSGHRGLPSAKLFTDLDQLVTGDTFIIRVLDETLTYEVDQIRIVEPYDVGELKIVDDKDYCTLVTCTPYGINTHRLLVRGHQVENQNEANAVRVTADAIQVEPVIVAPLVAVPMLLILLIVLLATTHRARDRKDKK